MARLSAAAHPREAIKEQLYVPQPGGATADQLARRLELEPTSSHLVVGGVGSGKTTQLLMVQQSLAAVHDVHPIFIEVSEKHDLAKLRSGVLLVLAGLALGDLVPKTQQSDAVKHARKRFRDWAHGWVEWVDIRDDYAEPPEPEFEPDDDGRYLRSVHYKGVLVPPEPELQTDIRKRGEQLSILRQAVGQSHPHVVLLFDSLDRLTDLRPFADVVEQDVRAIKSAGIGVVIVGPLRTLFGVGRPIADRFDYLYHLASVDVERDAVGEEFFARVLRKRVEAELLPDEALRRIVQFSGGVLRDLISMARGAGEEAYTAGADRIGLTHVEAAADSFGRALMLGLGSDEVEVLQRVRTKGSFVQTSDKDIALLVTRRVLEYGNGVRRFAVHPTIAPLLEQLASKS